MPHPLDSGDSKLRLPGVRVTAFHRAPAGAAPVPVPVPAPGAARRARARGGQGRAGRRPEAAVRGAPRRAAGSACAPGTAPGEGTISGFPPLRQGEGEREVVRREPGCAGSAVRERRRRFFAAALSKVRVKCDTPAEWEQGKLPLTHPSSPPPPFSMETRKRTRRRRRRRVCYGKVSPWSETVSGVSAGSELPVSGEGRRQAGRQAGREGRKEGDL